MGGVPAGLIKFIAGDIPPSADEGIMPAELPPFNLPFEVRRINRSCTFSASLPAPPIA
jgi:hypothetical protein